MLTHPANTHFQASRRNAASLLRAEETETTSEGESTALYVCVDRFALGFSSLSCLSGTLWRHFRLI